MEYLNASWNGMCKVQVELIYCRWRRHVQLRVFPRTPWPEKNLKKKLYLICIRNTLNHKIRNTLKLIYISVARQRNQRKPSPNIIYTKQKQNKLQYRGVYQKKKKNPIQSKSKPNQKNTNTRLSLPSSLAHSPLVVVDRPSSQIALLRCSVLPLSRYFSLFFSLTPDSLLVSRSLSLYLTEMKTKLINVSLFLFFKSLTQ